KALLFLAAGSVIHAVLGEQDIRKMGQLRKFMPITYITMLIAGLALAGIPPFAGFWSKDLIIEAVGAREMGWIGQFAYFAVLSGVFMTAFYTFRMFFLTFHNSDRVPAKTKSHLHESPKVITVPLVLLAIGALVSGAWGVLGLDIANPEIAHGFFGDSLFVMDAHNPLLVVAEEGHHAWYHFLFSAPFWLAVGGISLAFAMYMRETDIPAKFAGAAKPVYTFLLNKWYWDELYERTLMRPAQCLGNLLWKKGDLAMIDKGLIHGGVIGGVLAGMERMRAAQTGFVYHYAFAMVIGVFGALTYLILKG
ncbi:MAG: proton-conducting transporter membrane subunit, partial [Mariprofundaceae bacterium]|nr:proton-conducting transporter membrane subunit [Mariprofundaceae bacterium]